MNEEILKVKAEWYDLLSGKGIMAAKIAAYLTDSQTQLQEKDKEIADLIHAVDSFESMAKEFNAQLQEQSSTIADLKKEIGDFDFKLDQTERKLFEGEATIERLREGLRWYADSDNYLTDSPDDSILGTAYCYKKIEHKARQLLSSIK